MKRHICLFPGFIHDEAVGLPATGIAQGTKREDVPENRECPDQGNPKSAFVLETS